MYSYCIIKLILMPYQNPRSMATVITRQTTEMLQPIYVVMERAFNSFSEIFYVINKQYKLHYNNIVYHNDKNVQ